MHSGKMALRLFPGLPGRERRATGLSGKDLQARRVQLQDYQEVHPQRVGPHLRVFKSPGAA